MRRAASIRPRSASSTAWQRSATASTAGRAVGDRAAPGRRRGSVPLARVTGLGPQSAAGGASARIASASRRSPAARAAASAASSARSAAPIWPEALEREGVDVVRLRLAGEVADGPHGARPRRRSTATISVSRSGSASTASRPS